MSAGCASTTVAWNQVSSAPCRVMPTLSVRLPCLMRVGSLWTMSLRPPSKYSRTSICADSPCTWVKNPTSTSSVGTFTSKLSCPKSRSRLIGPLALRREVIGGSRSGVVDQQVSALLALDDQVALEAVQEVLVRGVEVHLGRRGTGGRRRGCGLLRGRGRIVDHARDRVRRRREVRPGSGEVHGPQPALAGLDPAARHLRDPIHG